mgnify:CR=1 FL=1
MINPTQTPIRSICLVRLSALGDVLMFVPLIRTLQYYLPEAKLTWVISRPSYDLVENLDGVEFIVIDKPNGIRSYWDFKRSMSARTFDVLIAAQACYRANFLYPCIQAKRKIGYDRVRAKDFHWLFIDEAISAGCDHTLDGFLKFAEHLGISRHRIAWDIPRSEEDNAWANQHLKLCKRPILLINPASSKPERTWLIEHYISVIRTVQEKWGVTVILTGGPTAYDREVADQILQSVTCIDLVGKTKPKQLLAVIAGADLMLCPDTGPSHMAVAVGTPVIALHAVTSSWVSGPYTFRKLAIDYYPTAIQKILNTTKEKNIWGTHAHGKNTMALIPLEDVLDKLAKVLFVGHCEKI